MVVSVELDYPVPMMSTLFEFGKYRVGDKIRFFADDASLSRIYLMTLVPTGRRDMCLRMYGVSDKGVEAYRETCFKVTKGRVYGKKAFIMLSKISTAEDEKDFNTSYRLNSALVQEILAGTD